jgi:hypothetical protein
MRALLCALAFAIPALAQEEAAFTFDQAVDAAGPPFFFIDFEVPAGTAEIEVRHASVDDDDVIDFGLEDQQGFRGWGGGNSEPAIVGVRAASRSYRPGPIEAGTWHVVVGKAQLVSDAPALHIEVFLRTEATLPDALDRAPYEPAILSTTARFYAGDLHVHSEDSGDARPALAEIAAFARGKGLDFVVVTDHNTDSHVDRITPAQALEADLLFVPGVELTTYGGHATGFGVTRYVDHKVAMTTSVDDAVADVHGQGGLFSINHPVLDLGDVCIGCAWINELPPAFDGVEIATGGYAQSGFIFDDDARDFWDRLLDEGRHLAPVGGSDDHRAGVDVGAFGSPIGDPTTLVFAESLSVAALQQGIRDSRTVVKLQGPDDAMIDLQTSPARTGDSVVDDGDITLTAIITGGLGQQARFLLEGFPFPPEGGGVVDVDADPFTFTRTARAPDQGEERWRVEVLVDGHVQVVTGNVWLRKPEPVAPGGCGCAGSPALLLVFVGLRRRRRRAM